MRLDKPLLLDGSTLQDAIRACGAQHAGLITPKLAASMRTLAKDSVIALGTAFIINAQERYWSWGLDIPKHASAIERSKWAHNPYLFGGARVEHLVDICGQQAIQYADDLNIRMFWGHGCDLRFRTPDLISPCRDCRRLFFHSDSRRMICNDCQRKNERRKKRKQRGTDLSERTCPVCSSKFTPKRSHAVCCSARCRAALSRKAKGIKEPLPG